MIAGCITIAACTKTQNGNTTTTTTIPPAPTTLSGSSLSGKKILLQWIDNSTNEDGFKIERKDSTGVYLLIAIIDKNIAIYLDSNLAPNRTYTYRVYSYNTIGNSINYSNEITLKPIPILPKMPLELRGITLSNSSSKLFWNDTANNESGYKVLRKKSSVTNYSVISSLPSNCESFIDINLSDDTKYDYKILAYNDDGNSDSTSSIGLITDDLIYSQQLKSNLVAWYPFNNDVIDESGNNNNFYGTFYSGYDYERRNNANSALNLTPSWRTFSVTDRPSFNFTNAFSVSHWVKCLIYPLQSASDLYLSKINVGLDFSGWMGRLNADAAKDSFNFEFSVFTTTNMYFVNTPLLKMSSTLYQWHHLVYVYDGSSIKIYLNGVLSGQKTVLGNFKNSTTPFIIGKNTNIGNMFNSGSIDKNVDDIGIWNRVLTQGEITYLYNH